MIAFKVRDMFLRRSAAVIITSVKAVDSDAKVRVDTAQHRVEIEPSMADALALGDAISEAGFTPVLLPATPALANVRRLPPRIPFDGPPHDFSPG